MTRTFVAIALALLIVPLVAVSVTAAPVAILDATPRDADIDEIVSLDASRSTPGSGAQETEYNFVAGDGAESGWQSAGIWQHSYSSKGTYTATVIVRNEFNDTSSETVSIEVGKEDDALLFGLTPLALILVIVVVVLLLGIVLVLARRKKKAAEEPWYDDYEHYTGEYESPAEEKYDTESYPEKDEYDAYDDEPSDDFMDEDVEEVEPVAVAPVRPRKKRPAGARPVKKKAARPAGAAPVRRPRPAGDRPVKRKRPDRSGYERPRPEPEPEPYHEPEEHYHEEPEEQPEAPAEKSLLVDCPNCANEMTIKYTAPPVYLTCDQCGMKGEIPEEMLE